MEAPIKNPLDQLLPTIHKAIDDWHSLNTPEKISHKIHTLLDENREEVVLKLMGFNARWGDKWEVDHCNNRSGNSVIGNYMQTAQKKAIEDWIDSVGMPTLTATVKKQIASSMRELYTTNFRRSIERLVQQRAEQDAYEFLNDVLTPVEVKSYADLINLLTPKE